MQRGGHVLLAAIAGSVVVAFSTSTSRATGRAHAIDALDRCVQDRFVRIDKGFGVSRISTAMHNTRQFVPDSDSERQAVRDFETLGMRVVMYVASPQRPRWGPVGAAPIPPLIQGPVFVSPTPQVVARSVGGAPFEVSVDPQFLKDLPGDAAVKAQGVQSLKASAGSDSREFEIGRWRFVARPVRASAAECLRCHNRRTNETASPSIDRTADEPFRLGDPLGVVLYGYQSVRSPL